MPELPSNIRTMQTQFGEKREVRNATGLVPVEEVHQVGPQGSREHEADAARGNKVVGGPVGRTDDASLVRHNVLQEQQIYEYTKSRVNDPKLFSSDPDHAQVEINFGSGSDLNSK